MTRTEIWIIGARPSVPHLTPGSNCLCLDSQSSSHIQLPAAATCGVHSNLVRPQQARLSELLGLLQSPPPCAGRGTIAIEQLLRAIQTPRSAKRALSPSPPGIGDLALCLPRSATPSCAIWIVASREGCYTGTSYLAIGSCQSR